MTKDKLKTKQAKDNIVQPIIMRSLPAEDVDNVIAMLRNHSYGKEEMDECGWNANKMEHLDAHAFDNAVMITLLGGELGI